MNRGLPRGAVGLAAKEREKDHLDAFGRGLAIDDVVVNDGALLQHHVRYGTVEHRQNLRHGAFRAGALDLLAVSLTEFAEEMARRRWQRQFGGASQKLSFVT